MCIKLEVKRRCLIFAKRQLDLRNLAVLVPPVCDVVGRVPAGGDEYWEFFADLPTRIIVPVPLQPVDCELAVQLEMMAYEREEYLQRILSHGVDENGDEFCVYSNPLDWWKERDLRYPILSALSRSVLCVPATSAPCERLFSHAGLTIANDRASLLPDNAAEIIYLRVAWEKVEALKRMKMSK